MTFKTDRQKSAVHPNQKPVELLRYLIRAYTNPGDTVMDPVAGSGTTGIAAYEEGRDSLLVEIDRQFFDDPIRRRRKTSGVSIWMWMILWINIKTDNENKKDRVMISYPSIIM